MVWPGWRRLPPSVQRLRGDPAAVQAAVLAHIDAMGSATSGLVHEWDVLNEPFDHHDLMDLCGRGVMVDWFRRARDRLPRDCRLFINDFGIVEAGGATDTPHQRHYEDTIAWLLAQGAPLAGIGLQSHFGVQPTPPAVALAILDRYARFGLPLVVTEFDVDHPDEAYQAAYLRDYLTLCFSHPAISGFLMWGFWEGLHWRPRAAPLRRDWSSRPSMEVWRELTQRTWWTETMAVSGPDGLARVRGFKGAYAIQADGTAAVTTEIGDLPSEVVLR